VKKNSQRGKVRDLGNREMWAIPVVTRKSSSTERGRGRLKGQVWSKESPEWEKKGRSCYEAGTEVARCGTRRGGSKN